MSRIRSIKPEFWTSAQSPWSLGPALYVVSERSGKPTKIGICSHPARRLSALQCGNSRQINLRAVYVGDRADCLYVEKSILARFKALRLLGEWMNVMHSDVIAEIEAGNNG